MNSTELTIFWRALAWESHNANACLHASELSIAPLTWRHSSPDCYEWEGVGLVEFLVHHVELSHKGHIHLPGELLEPSFSQPANFLVATNLHYFKYNSETLATITVIKPNVKFIFKLNLWLTAPGFSGVFLSCKANARRSVHSPQDHFIITLIISDRRG